MYLDKLITDIVAEYAPEHEGVVRAAAERLLAGPVFNRDALEQIAQDAYSLMLLTAVTLDEIRAADPTIEEVKDMTIVAAALDGNEAIQDLLLAKGSATMGYLFDFVHAVLGDDAVLAVVYS